jgi:hypothetical protein
VLNRRTTRHGIQMRPMVVVNLRCMIESDFLGKVAIVAIENSDVNVPHAKTARAFG